MLDMILMERNARIAKLRLILTGFFANRALTKKVIFFFVFFLNLKICFYRNLLYVRNQNNGCEVLPSI